MECPCFLSLSTTQIGWSVYKHGGAVTPVVEFPFKSLFPWFQHLLVWWMQIYCFQSLVISLRPTYHSPLSLTVSIIRDLKWTFKISTFNLLDEMLGLSLYVPIGIATSNDPERDSIGDVLLRKQNRMYTRKKWQGQQCFCTKEGFRRCMLLSNKTWLILVCKLGHHATLVVPYSVTTLTSQATTTFIAIHYRITKSSIGAHYEDFEHVSPAGRQSRLQSPLTRMSDHNGWRASGTHFAAALH